MATTCRPIGKITTTSSNPQITISNIPANYTDLLIAMSLRSDHGGAIDSSRVRFNGAINDTGLSSRELYGSGTAAFSGTYAYLYGGGFNGGTTTASTFSSIELYIPNYAGATNKSVSITYVQENNATTAYRGVVAGLWSNTAAINQITWTSNNANFIAGCTVTIYGITKA